MVKHLVIDKDWAGQRIDNFLLKQLKGVPKSRLYRGIRKGECRINGGRISADYRLRAGDRLRVPPLHRATPTHQGNSQPPTKLITQVESRIVYEDDLLLAINKPSGIPSHGGTQISWGLIELLRQLRPQPRRPLELIHRLDRETSGCLLIAKKRVALLEWQALLRQRQVKKQYLLLVQGHWRAAAWQRVEHPLKKNVLQNGQRLVTIDRANGKPAITRFRSLKHFKTATLLLAEPITGRTHQIRVHAAAEGHPIVGDNKYGDYSFNHNARQQGLKRLFLHAHSISCQQPTTSTLQNLAVPLDQDLQQFLEISRA